MGKPTPDFTVDDMMTELGITPLYEGPGAHTTADMAKKSGRSYGLCRDKAEENVQSGLWVKVSVRRTDRSKRVQCIPAYVNKKVYEQHMSDGSGAGFIGISQEDLG